MARSDSVMIGLLAVAQLMLWQYLQDQGVNAVAEIFGVTGGTTALLAIYFLTSVGKYQKEFDNSYSKLEKTRLDRDCLLYTSPSPRDRQKSRMPSSA